MKNTKSFHNNAKTVFTVTLVAAAAWCSFGQPAHATVPLNPILYQQQKLVSPGGLAGDQGGFSAALDGDTMVYGSPYAYIGPISCGRADVFVRSAGVWTHQQTLLAPTQSADEYFGYSVDLSGDTIIVGALQDETSGRAHIYTRTGTVWSLQQSLSSASPFSFGYSVAIDGDTVLVGDPAATVSGFDGAGAGQVYTRSGTVWTLQDTLEPSDPSNLINVGFFVDLDGDIAVISSPLDDDFGGTSGSAYVFERSLGVWSQTGKLLAPDAEAVDNFGYSCAVSGNSVIIGSPYGDGHGNDSGSAYIFTGPGTWTFQQELFAPDNEFNQFGWCVSLDGDKAIVGANLADESGGDSGSAYIFTRSGVVWTPHQETIPCDGAATHYAGWGVFIKGNDAIMTAPGADGFAGAAYVFSVDPTPAEAVAATGDATQAAGTIDGTYSVAPCQGSPVASVDMYVKTPGGSWANSGPVTGGTFAYSPSAGDGLYEFSTVATDQQANTETAPTGSDPGEVSILWNSVADSTYSHATVADGTYLFPMTDTLDMSITFAGGAAGGPITVSRTTGDVAPGTYSAARLIDESLSITGTLTSGSATITWNFDPASDDTLSGSLDTVFQFETGSLVNTFAVTPSGDSVVIGPVTGFSDWYAGAANAGVEDWMILND